MHSNRLKGFILEKEGKEMVEKAKHDEGFFLLKLFDGRVPHVAVIINHV